MKVGEFLGRLEGVRRSGLGWSAKCPAHEDRTPSLTIGAGEKGIVLKCMANCSTQAVVDALGIPMSALFYDQKQAEPNGWRPVTEEVKPKPISFERATEIFDYHDEKGRLLFRAGRFQRGDKKTFAQGRPDPDCPGAFLSGLGDARRLLYRLPRVHQAIAAASTIFLVEGEKAVHAVEGLGLTATTSPGGAGKWRDEYAEMLRGASSVVVIPDDDDAGRAHALQAADSLARAGIPTTLAMIFPGGWTKRDVADWSAHATTDEDRALAKRTLEDLASRHPRVNPLIETEAPVSVTSKTSMPIVWLERASDLLAEPDPGPTPFLVEQLIVDQAIAAMVGSWKVAKSYALLELAISVVTGRDAFGAYSIPEPGPVVLVLEESGRAALHRRLDRLRRGYALSERDLHELHFAANRGVRLNDPDWQQRLLEAGAEIQPRAIFLDPIVRMKGAIDENQQKDWAPVLDFMRTLRDESGAAVVYVNHTGHTGTHQRGSSDLEGYWESRLALTKDDAGVRMVTSEHREAESGHSFRFMLDFDETTRSLRMGTVTTDLEALVETYMREHPTASKNAVAKNVNGRRADVLRHYDAVKKRLEDPLWKEAA